MSSFHTSVLLKETVDYLQVSPGKKYIDATLGGGGHTRKILELGGIVLGIDVDEDALDFVRKDLESRINNSELILARGNFREIDVVAHLKKFNRVSGIVFDLGVSSHQIDTPSRGFSFLREGPLDMRMDKDSGLTAEALVNLLEKGELNELFNKFGEEHRSYAVSSSIARARRVKAIRTTSDLVKVIQDAYGIKGDVSDFTKNLIGKKVFQALRIAVNGELENLTEALPKAVSLLEEGGRIAIISFHSLEDRIVKKIFKDFEQKKMGKIITLKPVEPALDEVKSNPRAKSAKLRVLEKI